MGLTRVNNQALTDVTSAGIPQHSGAIIQTVTDTSGQNDAIGTSYESLGFNLSITPSSTSSKILLQLSGGGLLSASGDLKMRIKRNGTVIQTLSRFQYKSGTDWTTVNWAFNYMDDPATTSACVYTIEAHCAAGSDSLRFNNLTTNISETYALLMAMEIAG